MKKMYVFSVAILVLLPAFTSQDVAAESNLLLALNFTDSATIKIYNFVYDSSDSNIVINQELLAEVKVFKR
jgi:hypothetical protein